MPTFNWIGQEAVVEHHRRVPLRLLECEKELSAGDPDAGNLLVEGDNLEALRALMPRYKGQVKCVYIDPPYNTGNEGWVYNDNVNDPRIKKWLEGTLESRKVRLDDLCRHDKWLCMMYPRLALLRDLLDEDGLIFISIDDNEVASLRHVCDEVFGARNWLATMVRRAMHTVRNSSKDFNLNIDYVLAYARDKSWHGADRSRYIRVPADKSGSYPHDDNDGKGPYKLDPLHARNYYEPYTFTFRNGTTWRAPAGRYPTYSEDTLREKDSASEIVFRRSGPMMKRYLREVQEGQPPDALLRPEDVAFNKDGTSLLARMIGGGLFAQPKPVQLIRHLLSMVRDKNAVILDSFAGSGTTGHAVLAQNKADGGNRRFILVELDDAICRNVTAKRLRKAIEGYGDEPGLGGGFRFCKLGRTLFDENGEINREVPFVDLARYVYLLETGMPAPTRPRCDNPLLGVHNGLAVFLLYNGVLGDRRPAAGNVLTHAVLGALPAHPAGPFAPRVVYGEACRLSAATLHRINVIFRQIPYALREG